MLPTRLKCNDIDRIRQFMETLWLTSGYFRRWWSLGLWDKNISLRDYVSNNEDRGINCGWREKGQDLNPETLRPGLPVDGCKNTEETFWRTYDDHMWDLQPQRNVCPTSEVSSTVNDCRRPRLHSRGGWFSSSFSLFKIPLHPLHLVWNYHSSC